MFSWSKNDSTVPVQPMNENGQLATLAEISSKVGLPEALEAMKAQRDARTPTRAKLRLVEAAQAIREEPEELRTAMFMAKFLIQCTLPHSDPGDVPIWQRTNNDYTLAIQPGWDFQNNCSMGYPYGTLPRLLLIFLITQAKRTGCRRVELGNSLTEFLRKLDLEPRSRHKKHSDAVRIKDATRRLFSANIMFYKRLSSTVFDGERLKKSNVSEEHNLLWDNRHEDQAVLWGSWIELGPTFFAAIMESAVPCNTRAIRELRRSPLALDLYMLCNWLGANLEERGRKEHFMQWNWLAEQLGSCYKNVDDLKRKIKKEMRKVKLAHPELRWSYDNKRGGIIVRPSPPAIPKRRAIA